MGSVDAEPDVEPAEIKFDYFADLQKHKIVRQQCGYCPHTKCVDTSTRTMLIIFGCRDTYGTIKTSMRATTPDGFSIEVGDSPEYLRYKDDRDLAQIFNKMTEDARIGFIQFAQEWIASVEPCAENAIPTGQKVLGRIYGIPHFPYDYTKTISAWYGEGKQTVLHSYMFRYPTVEELIGLRVLFGDKIMIGEWTYHLHGN